MSEKLPGPNAPCWCGSAIKYKKCHRNREEQLPERPWVAVETIRKAFQVKKCCADDGSLGPCEGKIIHAHSVSRGANLAAIARNGKVIQYGGEYATLEKSGGRLVPTEIGIKQASTFNGFCAKHDAVLFSSIENDAFVGRPDQCLAIAYRNISRDLYGKDAATSVSEALNGADKGLPFADQMAIQQWLAQLKAGNDMARRELRASHETITQAVASGKVDAIRSLILECNGPLPFMMAAAWSPIKDLWDNEIQPPWNNVLLEQIFLSTFAATGKSYICLSWLNKDRAPGQIIADQISACPSAQQAGVCMQFAVKHAENVFFSPDWFESLKRDQRSFLDRLAADGNDAMGSPPSVRIRPDLSYDLPTVIRAF